MLGESCFTVSKLNVERPFSGRVRKFSNLAFVGMVMTVAGVMVISSISDPAVAQVVVPTRPVPYGSYGSPGNTYGGYGYYGGNYSRGYSNPGSPYGVYGNPGYYGGNYSGSSGNPGGVVPDRPIPYRGYGNSGNYGSYIYYYGGSYPSGYVAPGSNYGTYGGYGYYRGNYPNGYSNPGGVVPDRPIPYGGYGNSGNYGGYGYYGGNYRGGSGNPGNAYGTNGYPGNFNTNPYGPYGR
jgi:hypothetical protein